MIIRTILPRKSDRFATRGRLIYYNKNGDFCLSRQKGHNPVGILLFRGEKVGDTHFWDIKITRQ